MARFQVTTMMAEAEKEGKPLPMANGKARQLLDSELFQFDYSKDFFQKPAFLTVSGQPWPRRDEDSARLLGCRWRTTVAPCRRLELRIIFKTCQVVQRTFHAIRQF